MRSASRPGLGEVISSLAMLAVAIALLGGLSVISLQSLRGATTLLTSGSDAAADEEGLLIAVVSEQSNSSGSYVWLYDYGWVGSPLSSVYVNGGAIQGWSSSCSPVSPASLCYVRFPSGFHGPVTLLFGGRSVDISV